LAQFSSKQRGTEGYFATELLNKDDGPQFSTKPDIWAMGCILYEFAVGRRPSFESTFEYTLSTFPGAFENASRAVSKSDPDLAVESSRRTISTHQNIPFDLLRKYSTGSSLFLLNCINLAWKKLDEYYQLATAPHVPCGCSFGPRIKFQYFEKRWVSYPDWVITAKDMIRSLFEEYKQRYGFALPLDACPKSPLTPSTLMTWNFGLATLSEISIDKLDHYLSTELE
jgi:serine/threonine protein kinase